MKYMHSEWRRRLEHWIETLKKDLYHPLESIETEYFITTEHLMPGQAERQSFMPAVPGMPWGKTWEYCWLRGRILLPPEAAGKRVVMDLCTGGETTVFLRHLPGRLGGRASSFYRGQRSDVLR